MKREATSAFVLQCAVGALIVALVAHLVSVSALAQVAPAESEDAADNSLVFKAGRSHAAGYRYIPVTLTLKDGGINWRFEEEFKREVDIAWSSLESWGCWGKTYGYTLSLEVEHPENGGGSFKLSRDELRRAEAFLDAHVTEKAKKRCEW
jgi:hypothetical protein